MTNDDEPNDNKSGDQTNINSGGGDVAGRDIDKRQGKVFVEHSTIHGNVIGEQTIHLPLVSPALHQLRAPVSDFVGREREIDQLVQALSKAAGSGAAAAISGVRGMGGVGKTELAYVVANRLKDNFPDAQLVVELRGASSNPLTPEQALQTVIRAFEGEVKPSDDLSQLQAIYRARLSSKRVLILADDASDIGQIRQLMPPPGCALLVTSRNRFGLPGMVTIDLRALPPEEAEKLLLEICPRIRAQDSELAELCGYLPLALRVSASLLKENDSRDVAYYLEQLRVERLRHLSDPDNPDDPQASVEASLRLSYEALGPAAQSALCQMSVFPASFDLVAAKEVILVEKDLNGILEVLRRRSLLEWEPVTREYNLHDLVRSFAEVNLRDGDTVKLRYAKCFLRQAKNFIQQTPKGILLPTPLNYPNLLISDNTKIDYYPDENQTKHVLDIIANTSQADARMVNDILDIVLYQMPEMGLIIVTGESRMYTDRWIIDSSDVIELAKTAGRIDVECAILRKKCVWTIMLRLLQTNNPSKLSDYERKDYSIILSDQLKRLPDESWEEYADRLRQLDKLLHYENK